jgi:hypothetical protein
LINRNREEEEEEEEKNMLGLKFIYENPRFGGQLRLLAALPDTGNVAYR